MKHIEPGLLLLKKKQHNFYIVSKETLIDLIASIPADNEGNMVKVDTRLKESCDLVNYYLPLGLMPLYRLMGCNTPQVAFTSQGVHFVHEALIRLSKPSN